MTRAPRPGNRRSISPSATVQVPLGPKDTDAGPEGEYPDPDEYAGADDH